MRRIGNNGAAADDLGDFVRDLRRKGVTLWADGKALRYRAPKGVLTPEERQVLTQESRAIAHILHTNCYPSAYANRSSGQIERRRAPLTLTQLDHWSSSLISSGKPIRQVAAVTRLRGHLRVGLLRQGIRIVVRRHDALRTRIVISEDLIPLQEISEEYCSDLEIVPLFSLPEPLRAAEIQNEVQRAILDADGNAVSQLFKAVLLLLEETEHVLILALEHIISDFASLNILSTEIFSVYAQLLKGGSIELPPVQIQFADFAVRLQSQYPVPLVRLKSRFDSVARTRFPSDPDNISPGSQAGWAVVNFRIDANLREQLRVWAQMRRTTIVLATLTAYSALIARWCGVRDTVIQVLTEGRTEPELGNTIGYLAFRLNVGLTIHDRATFLDILHEVIREYCRACDEADFGYASTRVPRPDFTRNTAFNWLPARGARQDLFEQESKTGLVFEPIPFSNPCLGLLNSDDEPSVCFVEDDNRIAGEVAYPLCRFSAQYAEKFADNIKTFLVAMVRDPTVCIKDVNLM